MRIALFFLITLLIPEVPESSGLIEKTRDQIAVINLSLYDKLYPHNSDIEDLSGSIHLLDGLGTKQFTEKYLDFLALYKNNSRIDTLQSSFRTISSLFNTLFGKHFLEKPLSGKTRIVLLTTSVSCACTIDMCYEHEVVIQKLYRNNPGRFDYAIVDCFLDFELSDKHNIGYVPAVLVLDGSGKELKRFVREENFDLLLSNYLEESR